MQASAGDRSGEESPTQCAGLFHLPTKRQAALGLSHKRARPAAGAASLNQTNDSYYLSPDDSKQTQPLRN
jgi:hypothetical protein